MACYFSSDVTPGQGTLYAKGWPKKKKGKKKDTNSNKPQCGKNYLQNISSHRVYIWEKKKSTKKKKKKKAGNFRIIDPLCPGYTPKRNTCTYTLSEILKYAHSSIISNSPKLKSSMSINVNCLNKLWNIQTMEHNKILLSRDTQKTMDQFHKILNKLRY